MNPCIFTNSKNKWVQYFRLNKRVYQTVARIPSLLRVVYGVPEDISYRFLQKYIYWWEENTNYKGQIWSIKFLKELYGQCLRFSVGHSFKPMEYQKLNKSRLPLLTEDLIPLLTGNLQYRRAALYLLQTYKLALVPGDSPNTESITKPFSVKFNWLDYKSAGKALRDLALMKGYSKSYSDKLYKAASSTLREMFPKGHKNKRLELLNKNSSTLHVSTKNGPNGHSFNTMLFDSIALKKCQLWNEIYKYAYITKNKVLRRCMWYISIFGVHTVDGTNERSIHSKLSVKHETGGKTRFFAILDWFTQSSFRGLHITLFNILKGIKEDGTHDHSKLAKLLGQWTDPKYGQTLEYSSVDLSLATDRLPSGLQMCILSQIFNKDIAMSWYNIMTQREFCLPDGETKVLYAVGQPMGALSSWAMLAITHHFIVRTSLKMSKYKMPNELLLYGVIGDDLGISGNQSTEYYTQIMHNILEVEISPIKGYSKSTLTGQNQLIEGHSNTVIELAKKVIVNGNEITPGSPVLLKAVLDDPVNFPNLLNDLFDRTIIRQNDLKTITALANLSYKPKLAIEYALFPTSPARCIELGELEKNEELTKIIWFSNPLLTMEQITTKINALSRSRILTLYETFILKLVNQRPDQDLVQGTKSGLLFSKSKLFIARLLIKQVMNLFDTKKIMVSSISPEILANLNKTLKELEGLPDIEVLLDKSNKSYTERSKSKTFKAVLKFVKKSVSENKTVFPISTEIINNSIELEKYREMGSTHLTDLVIEITVD